MRFPRPFATATSLSAALVLATPLLAHAGTSPADPADSPDSFADGPVFESTDVASAGEGAHTWRIPALEVLDDGTLIAAYDQRKDDAGDLPGDIDIVISRSDDNGSTWTDPQTVVSYEGEIGAGDPSLLVDSETGRVFLFHAYAPEGVGFFESATGDSNDATDILHTDVSYSDDGGDTWTTERLTEDIKDPEWNGIFASSGTGIQLSDGRLLQQYAYQHNDEMFAVSAYSDDNGDTWQSGEPVGPLMDENKTVELSDGRVMLNSRTASGDHRLVAYSDDGGISYSDPEPDTDLPDPANNASILRYDADTGADDPEAQWLLFSNTASTTEREDLTVRMSCDDGESWPISRTIDPDSAAYSTMVRLDDGTFGVLYERGPYDHITFARFNDAWLGADCDQ